MAITSGFFNSINGDRKYNARQIGRYLGGLVSSGVFPNPSTNLQILAGGGMVVQASPGKAFIDCHWLENDSMHTIILDDADMVLDRMDAVVMRLDESDGARSVDIVVKKGAPSSEPRPPQMERGDGVQEYCLATVRVRKMKDDGTQEITQADITDTRADTDVCGWVTGLIDQVDTHTLFLQWQDAYGRFYEESEAEFKAWIEGIREQFGEEAVGSILDLIDGLDSSKANKTDLESLREDMREATARLREAMLELDEEKANRASVIQMSIQASQWSGDAIPYEVSLQAEGVTNASVIDIGLAPIASIEQAKAWMAGQFADGGQADGIIKIRAFGRKPEMDIPITVVIRGDA